MQKSLNYTNIRKPLSWKQWYRFIWSLITLTRYISPCMHKKDTYPCPTCPTTSVYKRKNSHVQGNSMSAPYPSARSHSDFRRLHTLLESMGSRSTMVPWTTRPPLSAASVSSFVSSSFRHVVWPWKRQFSWSTPKLHWLTHLCTAIEANLYGSRD